MTLKRIILTVLLGLLVFAAACSSKSDPKLPREELDKLITQVSKRYGESRPRISLKETEREGDFKPMYLVFLKGDFTKGNLRATNLSFSMLADGTYIWAIVATDDDNRVVWEEE